MQFLMKEIVLILGISRDRINKWMKMGAISPSVKQGSGRGSSQNIFSFEDLCTIAVFKKIIESGWYGKIAKNFIKAINRENLGRLITWGARIRDFETYELMLSRHISQKLPKALEKHEKFSPETIKKIVAEYKKLLPFPPLYMYLAFVREKKHDNVVKCIPIVEGGPKLEKKSIIAMELKDLGIMMHDSNDAYVLDVSSVMSGVDKRLVELYPEEMGKRTALAHSEIHDAIWGE